MTKELLEILRAVRGAENATELLAIKQGFASLKAGEAKLAQRALNARFESFQKPLPSSRIFSGRKAV